MVGSELVFLVVMSEGKEGYQERNFGSESGIGAPPLLEWLVGQTS